MSKLKAMKRQQQRIIHKISFVNSSIYSKQNRHTFTQFLLNQKRDIDARIKELEQKLKSN